MAYLDKFSNFAKCTVSQGYSSAVTTNIDLSAGEGSKLPASTPYNLTWWNATDFADPADDTSREIIRVTARTGDRLDTVTRAQESTSAQNHNTAGKTYKMALCGTKKTMDDIEARLDNLEKSGFGAYRATSAQSITTAVDTKIQFQTEEFDLAGEYDPVTNYRFTATKPSVYQVSCFVTVENAIAGNAYDLRLKKNGATFRQSRALFRGTTNDEFQISLVTAISLTTSDTLEMFFFHQDGVSRNLLQGQDNTWFTAVAVGLYQRQ